MGELFDDTSSTENEGGTTARSTSRSSSNKSQFQSSTARSAISSAASTSDTISSNEEVHNYEEWELGFDVEDGSKSLSNTDDTLESSTDSKSQSSRCSLRSEQECAESTSDDAVYKSEAEATKENQIESCQYDGDQWLREHPETASTIEENKIESARSTSESSSWTDEPQGSENPATHYQYLSSGSEAGSCGDLEILSQPVAVADRFRDAKDELIDSRTSSPEDRPRDQDLKSVQRNIQVFVRVRPLPARHSESRDEAQVVKLGDDSNSIRVQAPSSHGANCVVTECSFDKVFMGVSTQEDVFSAVQPSIRASLDGYNATIFAYGQTGTGKTHTIFGEEADINFLADGKEESESLSNSMKATWGIIPRAMTLLLGEAETLGGMDVTVSLQCSFMQIYNDRLFDLLTDRRRQRPLIIREQPTLEGGTNVVLQGLSSERIGTLEEALQILRRGRANRSVRETELNSCSSRSHAIVQINITSERTLENGDKLIRKSRLNLVDLAGSEKWNTDLEMEDAHSQELKNINASLSALGNCIAALSEAGRRHIPYRDSTLTRLLQDSFGGNTQACLIATISPSVRACEETIRTLQFADRARSVMQSIRVNEALGGVSELQIAKAQISKLRERLESEQRRRHQTRVKEQEAAQKEFLEKLQVKDKEIQKLSRDNAVFSRWREEDLRKIRELESRVKELEVVAQVDVNAGAGGTLEAKSLDDLASRTQLLFKRHDEKENLLVPIAKNDAKPPQAGIKKTNSKKAISLGVSTMKKDDTAAIKPYRQILERYALGSKKSNRRQPERQPNETTTPPSAFMNRNKQQAENQAHSQAGVVANDNNQRMREREDNQDAVSAPNGRREMVSTATYYGASAVDFERKNQGPPEVERAAERIFGSPQRSVNNNHVSPVAATSYTGAWQSNVMTSYQTPASMTYEDTAAPSVPSNWRSQTNLYDQAFRSYLQPAPSPLSNLEPTVKKDTLVETGFQYQRSSVPTVSDVPDFEKVSKSTTTRESSAFVPFSTSSLAPPTSSLGSPDACEKHSLKGCVLCAVRDTRSQNILPNKPSLMSMTNASTELPSSMARAKPVADAARDGPCDRHHLASCFICGSSSSGPASLVQSAVESRLSSISNAFQQVSSRYEEEGSNAGTAAERNPLLMNDSKCDAHSLANCVLCAGVKAMSRKIQQGSPTRKAFQSDSLSASTSSAATWTSSRNLALVDLTLREEGLVAPSGSSLKRAEEQQALSPFSFNSTTQQHPLLRRHSVNFGATCELEGSTSPMKLLAHLRPQQSAVNLHHTTNDLTSSNFSASSQVNQLRLPDGAPHEATSFFSDQLPYLSTTQSNAASGDSSSNTPIQSTSPMKTSWQSAVRLNIKELAFDSNRKGYQALIREASGATAFVLRRK